MSELIRAYGKLGLGVNTLATHPGEIKERLIAAFHKHLVAVTPEVLPDEPKLIWKQVLGKVTSIKGRSREGLFVPSINALDEAGAVELAKMITEVEAMVASAIKNRS